MAPRRKLVVVLPCHALEDFPTHHVGEAAESLMANWTAAWHPRLIAQAARMPQWISSDFVTEDLRLALIFVPTLCAADLPIEVSEAVEDKQAILVAGEIRRDAILASEQVQCFLAPLPDEDLVQDFFALGYAWLQIQLMTRQLRYSSSMDTVGFSESVVAAAQACAAGEPAAVVRPRLAACFDLLLEERNNYYPSEPKILDLVLVAPNTSMTKMSAQLNVRQPLNLLFAGQQIERIERAAPEVLQLIKDRLSARTLGLAGTPYVEVPFPLLSIESAVHQIKAGLSATAQLPGGAPKAYASFAFGLSPQLPAILNAFRFEMAFHTTFSGGQLPPADSLLMNWQGIDGSTIPALTAIPIDANQPDGFLKLGMTIGQSLDAHHHCTLIMAHWPNQVCDWYDSLQRITHYGPLFGRPRTLTDYCGSIHDNGFSETFDAEDYRFPWLEQMVSSGAVRPISRFVQYWRQLYRVRALRNVINMLAASSESGLNFDALGQQLNKLQLAIDECSATGVGSQEVTQQIDDFIEQLPLREIESGPADPGPSNLTPTESVVNPVSFSRRMIVAGDQNAVVELDAFEIAQISLKPRLVAASDPSVLSADGDTNLPLLRNEFFEVQIDPRSGGIRSVNRQGKRSNLLSQQLAIRTTESWRQHGFPRTRSHYATAEVEEIHTFASANIAGSIKTSGCLVDHSDKQQAASTPLPLARFEQVTTVTRGCRRIDFEVSIEMTEPLRGLPWQNYACSRLAWRDEDAMLYRGDNEIRQPVTQAKILAPNFIEICSQDSRLSLLPGGMPFHRRSDRRMLDTLLVVEGEEATRFQFSIAIDPLVSLQTAIDRWSPFYVACRTSRKQPGIGWLFHLNCRNVIVTHSEPCLRQPDVVSGCRLRIQETEGRAGELTLHCPATLKSAKRINLLGEPIADLQFDGDRVFCKFCEFQFFQLELGW